MRKIMVGLLDEQSTTWLYRLSITIVLTVALVSGVSAQPLISCDEEAARLRYLVQHFQAGRTAAEFEVARLQALSQALQRDIDRLKSASRQNPGGLK